MFLIAFITLIFGTNNVIGDSKNRLEITVYYESLCPLSQQVYSKNLVPVAQNLSEHITLKTNPYGFAHTFTAENGVITFECQHGPAECYGNKIHACALKYLTEGTLAVEFNGCMMERDREPSNNSVQVCASRVGVNASAILKCAESDEGNQFLKEYGAEIAGLDLAYLPAVFINGNVTEDPYGRHLYHSVCKAFTVKPEACQ